MKEFAWPLAFAIAFSALVLGGSWTDAEDRRTRSAIGVACAQAGMEFKVEWGKPSCTKKP